MIAWIASRSRASRVWARSRIAAASISATRRPRYGSAVSSPSCASWASASRTVGRLTCRAVARPTSVSFSPGRSTPRTMPRRIWLTTASRREIEEAGISLGARGVPGLDSGRRGCPCRPAPPSRSVSVACRLSDKKTSHLPGTGHAGAAPRGSRVRRRGAEVSGSSADIVGGVGRLGVDWSPSRRQPTPQRDGAEPLPVCLWRKPDPSSEVLAQHDGGVETHAAAICSTPRSLSSSRLRAARIRCWVTHWCGVVPVSATNRLANVRSLIMARRASDDAVCCWSRCSRTQVNTVSRLSVAHTGIGRSTTAAGRRRAGAVRPSDGDLCGYRRTEFAADQVQACVDAGRGPRAGDDRASSTNKAFGSSLAVG